MGPDLTQLNSTDLRLQNAELARDGLLSFSRGEHPEHLQNLSLVEFGETVVGAASTSFLRNKLSRNESATPSLYVSVATVIPGSTYKQVVGIHAARNVATVQHPETVRDGSIGERPSNTVSGQILFVDYESPVTEAVCARLP